MFCGSSQVSLGYSYFRLRVPCSDSGKSGLQSAPSGQELPMPLVFGMMAFFTTQEFREHSRSRFLPLLSFRGLGISERSKWPAGVAIGFSIQFLFLESPRLRGMDANALLR